ncbi:MAG: heparinase, partial [Microvirga sp.]
MARGPERWRLYGLALSESGRAVGGSLRRSLARLSPGIPSPGRLLFAPQDLRTADPTIATDIYSGFFAFAGRSITTSGRSPFEFAPPTRAWGEALYGFGWLRHLRAAGTALAQANARALVDEFVNGRHGDRRMPFETQIVARRLISFVSQSPLILEGADHAFYQRFLKIIGRHVRDLERDL